MFVCVSQRVEVAVQNQVPGKVASLAVYLVIPLNHHRVKPKQVRPHVTPQPFGFYLDLEAGSMFCVMVTQVTQQIPADSLGS